MTPLPLHYTEAGAGPALLLIHGMFGDHLDWQPVMEPLAKAGFRVIAVDLPGFGDSPKPDTDYTADLFVSSLAALLDSLGIGEAALGGNSFGGQIAMAFTLAHPGRVRRLVLADSGGFYAYSDAEKQLTIDRIPESLLLALDGPRFSMLFSPLFPVVTPETAAYVAKQAAKPAREDWAVMARSAARAIRLHTELVFLDRLDAICCPVQLVWGDRDPVVPLGQAQTALPLFRDARLTVLENCGHVPQVDQPEAFVKTVVAFLKGAQ